MKDYNEFWEKMKGSHGRHPSVRLRNYLIVNAVRQISDGAKINTVLDVGCGNGDLLKELSAKLCRSGRKMDFSGYDVSEFQIEKNRSEGLPFNFRVADFNERVDSGSKFDIVICSEVIEHLKNWKKALENIAGINMPGGYLILTTQSGRKLKADFALGHLQLFELQELTDYLKSLNYDIVKSEKRGFPFYNLQKIANSIFLPAAERVRHTETNLLTSILFSVTYFLFRISLKSKKLGPQIFILARKISRGG